MTTKTPQQSIRVFKSPILEAFTHVHPITPLVIWGPVAGYLIYRSVSVLGLGIPLILEIGVVAFLSWTLMEYGLHRFIFHFKPKTPTGERIAFLIHGIHHDDPNDATRLVMPPAASILLGILVYGITRSLLGPIYWQPFYAFFVIGYLTYDYIHYSVHHFRPRTAIGKRLKQRHMNHHFVSHEALWGVSSPLWDLVFGSMSEKLTEKKSH